MRIISGVSWDLNWFLQFLFAILVIAAFGLFKFLKNNASNYFEVDANFEADNPGDTTALPRSDVLMDGSSSCAVCGNIGSKKCSRCKAVRYCSQACQQSHWNSGHKTQCKDFKSTQTALTHRGLTASTVALVPVRGISKRFKEPKNVLFPYDEFVKLFNSEKPEFPPCGLLNCGNSCFANVVLQCLTFTRPLVAFLLERGHRRECYRNDWCFLCEFQNHVERVSHSSQAFSPMNILSRLPNIGGTLGYGRQEDAHEFMRFAIDTMQSVCLDEFGGEKAVGPSSQETTLIQHIFGGHLQSQVICTKCNNISNQYENMMDLTVEIHGDAASLEECLDQFTVKEWLHGENMYKCDGCNDYVKAWKRLTVKRAPNVLTIALKRFQSGRFGKLNKRVTFPETLDLSPYTSEAGDGLDIYKLYAVVVHVDMLNASFFGHYICYIKDFRGKWYRIDDWKVTNVDLEEVLSQGAYMLLYSRACAHPSCIKSTKSSGTEEKQKVEEEVKPCQKEAECLSSLQSPSERSKDAPIEGSPGVMDSLCENRQLSVMNPHAAEDCYEDLRGIDGESSSVVEIEFSHSTVETSSGSSTLDSKEVGMTAVASNRCPSISNEVSGREVKDAVDISISKSSPTSVNGGSSHEKEYFPIPMDCGSARVDLIDMDITKDVEHRGDGQTSVDDSASTPRGGCTINSGLDSFSSEKSSPGTHCQLKHVLPVRSCESGDGNGMKWD